MSIKKEANSIDKKFWLQLLGLVILILGATFLVFNSQYLTSFTTQFAKTNTPKPTSTSVTQNLKIVGSGGDAKAELQVEMADTAEKRTKGLGYRASLASGTGMFFVHDKPQKYTYWMKGMQFPIDIFWILNDKIVDIIPAVPPPIPGQTDETLERYAPTTEANRVLETNAGFAQANNIQIGDTIILNP